jgi:hypothetical protein
MVLILVPIVYLKENKITLPDFSVQPFERKTVVLAPAILMILAIISVLV